MVPDPCANKGKKDPTSHWKTAWQDEGKKTIEDIMKQAKERSGPPPEDGEDYRFSNLTEGDRNAIKAIERNISKIGFDCGMRAFYLAKEESFNGLNIPGLLGSLRQYGSNDLNSIIPQRVTQSDFPWQNYVGLRSDVKPFSFRGALVEELKWKLFDAYRHRSWYFPPYERKPFVLNIEELATIFTSRAWRRRRHSSVSNQRKQSRRRICLIMRLMDNEHPYACMGRARSLQTRPRVFWVVLFAVLSCRHIWWLRRSRQFPKGETITIPTAILKDISALLKERSVISSRLFEAIVIVRPERKEFCREIIIFRENKMYSGQRVVS